jgi:hypothetical protein
MMDSIKQQQYVRALELLLDGCDSEWVVQRLKELLKELRKR